METHNNRQTDRQASETHTHTHRQTKTDSYRIPFYALNFELDPDR